MPASWDEALEQVRDLNGRIKGMIPRLTFPTSRASLSEVREGFLDGKAVERVVVILRGQGCGWALQPHGGCTMCGHVAGTLRGDVISADDYVRQIERELRRYDFSRYPTLCLYNSGSFMNEAEVSAEAQERVLTMVRDEPGIKHVILETRPEFITDEGLVRVANLLSEKKVEIAMGLETSSDVYRRTLLNKGFTTEDFLRGARAVTDSGLDLLAYVLLKPAFMSEASAIKDAIASARFAFDHGASVVSIEPVSVQAFTLVHYLYLAGKYRPPWIWSVIDVARKITGGGEVRLGGFEFYPVPRIFTHNCDKCDPRAMELIRQYNSTKDVGVFDDLTCDCIDSWAAELSTSRPPSPELVLETLNGSERDTLLTTMKRVARDGKLFNGNGRLSSCGTKWLGV
jgi:radical SAM enzyme (TIGR01210 family)